MGIIMDLFPHFRLFVTVGLITFLMVLGANVVDCVDAIWTSRVAGQSIESAKLRHALWKLAKEYVLLLGVFMLDVLAATCWTKMPFATVMCGIVMVLIDVLSLFEHARLRKDKITKLPSHLKDLVDYFGEDEVKELIKLIARKKLNID